MELLVLGLAGVTLGAATFLILDRRLVRVVIGLGLLGNAINLLLLSSGGLTRGIAPVLELPVAATAVVDPIPQALILTAIVIGFGVTALLLALAFRTFQASTSDDLAELHGRVEDDE
ncbi:MAG: Na(+)/H(+) antiporter subunit C [Candidatus Dadabacteria bacterium]|nr:MAG: Na(+)/H(+) antiporter subunit C [Candidatus Dadabacteria bacterium]